MAPGTGLLPIEFWRFGVGTPRNVIATAKRAEYWGWDGIVVVDSQMLSGDCYVELARVAMSTERLRMGTAVTNPRTRHPAVTASAAATLQSVSDGRFMLGVGRGDSSLAHLGLAPVPVGELRRYVTQVRTYLDGEAIAFDELTKPGDRTVDEIGLARAPLRSR